MQIPIRVMRAMPVRLAIRLGGGLAHGAGSVAPIRIDHRHLAARLVDDRRALGQRVVDGPIRFDSRVDGIRRAAHDEARSWPATLTTLL